MVCCMAAGAYAASVRVGVWCLANGQWRLLHELQWRATMNSAAVLASIASAATAATATAHVPHCCMCHTLSCTLGKCPASAETNDGDPVADGATLPGSTPALCLVPTHARLAPYFRASAHTACHGRQKEPGLGLPTVSQPRSLAVIPLHRLSHSLACCLLPHLPSPLPSPCWQVPGLPGV